MALPKPRANHLYDEVTSRDLFGTVRGSCNGCTNCGKYIIRTKEKYNGGSGLAEPGKKHPDNDPTLTYCSRCGCPPEAHDIVPHETEKELGTDCFALHQWDAAILHYTRAIEMHPVDPTLWTNRSAAYLAKGWHSQALHDAERALALRPTWFRPWARKGAALLGLGKAPEAVQAYQKAAELAEGGDKTAMLQAIKEAQQAHHTLKKSSIPAQPTQKGTSSSRHRSSQGVELSQPKASTPPQVAIHTVTGPSDDSETGIPATATRKPITKSHSGVTRSGDGDGDGDVAKLLVAVQKQFAYVVAHVEALRGAIQELQVAVDEQSQQQGEFVQGATMDDCQINTDSVESDTVGDSEHSELPCAEDAEPGVPLAPVIEAHISPAQSSGEEAEYSASHSDVDNCVAGDIAAEHGSEGELGEEVQEDGMPMNDGTISSATSEGVADCCSTDEDVDDLSQWMTGVAAARVQMGMDSTFGFVPPPPTSSRRTKTDQQQPAESQEHERHDHEPAAAPASGPRLSFDSLQSMLTAAAAKRRRRDPSGIDRVACKACGPAACAQYVNIMVDGGSGFGVSQSGTYSDADPYLMQNGRLCGACGCDCSQHETENEAAARKERVRRAQERLQRQRSSASEAEDPQIQRSQRVAAAARRREEAEAMGEPVLVTDCDVLTHARRGPCTECPDTAPCPGFQIHYRTTDANKPEVMFYCSMCGCRADAHGVDEAWKREEERRKASEAAAANAARARQLAGNAALAARREEAEAYAILGLHFGADEKAVVKAYKRLALKLHPDKRGSRGAQAGEDGGHEDFVDVKRAYQLLVSKF